MQTETVRLNGQPFFLRSWGDPALPPLVLLHGFPEYGGAWAELAPLLTERYFCVAPDQRGFGRSWAPHGVEHYTGGQLAGDMAALIDQLGGCATVLGHDWGAAVAYGLAMQHPRKVDRLIVLNGVHPVPFQRALATGGAQTAASQYIHYLREEGAEDRLAADNFAKLLQLFSAKMDLSWLSGARLDAYRAEWARDGRLKTMLHWYRASPMRLGKPGEAIADLPDWPVERMMVRCPHLLIWGQDDTALLPEATEGLEAFAPDLTRRMVAGADHWLCHQKPAEVADLILDWSRP
jgi:pimeloyl-ACP methyl ester carboxylesterase